MATIKKVRGSSFEEYLEAMEVIKVLKSQGKPLTRLEMKKLGVKAERKSLRQLEKVSKITKEEHYAGNSDKTYEDFKEGYFEEDGSVLDSMKRLAYREDNLVTKKVLGTRYYTYSLVVEA